MTLVLARRADAVAPDDVVHAFELPVHRPPPVLWRAACGAELAAAEAEQVRRFTGAPCPRCLVVAFGTHQANPDSLNAAPPRPHLGTHPEIMPISPTGTWALALWGERTVHRVTDRRVRGQLEGRDVVQAVCGRLGWGPVLAPPEDWPVCEECQR